MKWLMIKWREAAFVATVVVFVIGWFDMKGDASDAKSIMEKQTSINEELKKANEGIKTKLEVYLEVYGFDDSLARIWNKMPRKMPKDSLGRPIPWEPWLETGSPYHTGIRFMVDDSADILIDTLWHFEVKE